MKFLITVVVLISLFFSQASIGTTKKKVAKRGKRNPVIQIVKYNATPAAPPAVVAVNNLYKGCVSIGQSLPYWSGEPSTDTVLTALWNKIIVESLISSGDHCLNFSAINFKPSNDQVIAVLIDSVAERTSFVTLLKKDNDLVGSVWQTKSVELNVINEMFRTVELNSNDLDINKGMNFSSIPYALHRELGLLITHMASVFGKSNSFYFRIVLQKKNLFSSDESVFSIEMVDSLKNEILETVYWLDRADRLGSYIGISGADYERMLWQSPLQHVRITRGVGKSSMIVKRRVAVKSNSKKKTKFVVRSFRYQGQHIGIDYAAPMGTPVYAVADAEVLFVGQRGGFGNLIILDHGDEHHTYYAHLSKFYNGISVGDKVRRGEEIGYVGSTGFSTGPHLHYEIRKNNHYVDPYISDQKLSFWGASSKDSEQLLVQMLKANRVNYSYKQ